MLTIAETIKQAANQLRTAEVPNDLLDAQTLLAHTLKQDRTYLIINFNKILPEPILDEYRVLIERRAAGEPLQYIVGQQQFYGLDFDVTPAVLIPRPETELIIEEILRLVSPGTKQTIIDVGTGSGCIAITLARELENAVVLATDISKEALDVARRNAINHQLEKRVEFHHTDLLNGLTAQADFIVSNPPYIAEEELSTLQREVRDWEPLTALTDFGDGLQFYRRLLVESLPLLKSCGFLIFEMGYKQSEKIKALVDDSKWKETRAIMDWQDIERILVLMKR